MYYNTYTPAWHFMMPPFQTRQRRRRREYDDIPDDPFEQLIRAKAFIKAWEEELKNNDSKKKDDKKPPNGFESLQMFMAQLAIMIVFGYPLGKLFIHFVETSFK